MKSLNTCRAESFFANRPARICAAASTLLPIIVTAACCLVLATQPALAQVHELPAANPTAVAEPTVEQPKVQAEDEQHTGSDLLATVTGVEGLVQVREAEGQPWQRAEVDMKVPVGAEFRTGPRSAVRFFIPPSQTVTLDRLGTIQVLQAVRQGKKVKTNLGMKYGRTRYDVEAAGVEYEATISSPSATLAIRGTQVGLFDQAPYTPQAWSLTGTASFKPVGRQARTFGDKKPTVLSKDEAPAEHAQGKAGQNSVSEFDGKTETEQKLDKKLPGLGGNFIKSTGVKDGNMAVKTMMQIEEMATKLIVQPPPDCPVIDSRNPWPGDSSSPGSSPGSMPYDMMNPYSSHDHPPVPDGCPDPYHDYDDDYGTASVPGGT